MTRYRIIALMILSVLLLTACGSTASTASPAAIASEVPSLLVSGGSISKAYTRSDLQALTPYQAVFNDVTYVGVSVAELVQDAGFGLGQVKAIKAVASDGYTVNYEPSQLLVNGVILAYARADGELAEDDGAFRLVLPGAEGKLNVRMLIELRIYIE